MKVEFPSPTGVNYYEFVGRSFITIGKIIERFPSPTGVNYYE